MTTYDKFAKIEANSNNNCRVHFNERLNRLPIVGMFVNNTDAADLKSKGMIRFVTTGKMDNYLLTNKAIYFTRILNVEEILDIKPFVCQKLI